MLAPKVIRFGFQQCSLTEKKDPDRQMCPKKGYDGGSVKENPLKLEIHNKRTHKDFCHLGVIQ